MDYLDIYNIPENAIESYIPTGGEVTPDLFDGNILRVRAEGNFNLERIKNQIDGVKFFVEVANDSDGSIVLSFDSDYRVSNLGAMPPVSIAAGAIEYYEMICRIGLIIVYVQLGLDTTSYIRHSGTGVILLNPKTGEPLINPGV